MRKFFAEVKNQRKSMTSALSEGKQANSLLLAVKDYLTVFFECTLVVTLGVLISNYINRFYPLEDQTVRLLQAYSVVPGAAGLFEVQRREIKTWSGKTPAELLNKKLFILFSGISLFLPVMSFSLIPFSANEPPSAMESRILEKLKSELLLEYKTQNLQFPNQN
ncbi:MAG: hypothetical protein CK425_11310 [Parachlamydia sp.]|nr:MAG: hypothetical protein CK425_11310 [Parachlamydia sp.]